MRCGTMLKLVSCSALIAVAAGCALLPNHGFLDQTKVGMFPGQAKERGIRRVLTARDTPPGNANATEPTPEDLVPVYDDYRLGPGDTFTISVPDLINPGQDWVAALEVSWAGEVRIPTVGAIKVAGLTENQVEEEIRNRLKEAEELPNPIVTVFIQQRRNRTFSILGNTVGAGLYPIVAPDMKLLDAFALARDVGAEVKKCYVIRQAGKGGPGTAPPATGTPSGRHDNGLVIPPPVDEPPSSPASFSTDAGMNYPDDPQHGEDQRARDEFGDVVSPNRERPRPTSSQGVQRESDRTFAPLIFTDPRRGDAKEVHPDQPQEEPSQPDMRNTAERQPRPSDKEKPIESPEKPFNWQDIPQYELSQRVIEIDMGALRAGDPRYNIVIRDRDVIQVPIDTGVFYVMGEVNRPGVYAFSGRDITVKQAIGGMAAGFSPLAWPAHAELIRREPGTDKQVTHPLNLDAIFAGTQDDLFLRDEDIINVGSDAVAPFLFVIRNSFRFTYGFGFVYDRNFADRDAYEARANPSNIELLRRQQRGLPF